MSDPAYGPKRTPAPSRGGSTFTGLVELLPVIGAQLVPPAESARVRLLPSRISRTHAVVGKFDGTPLPEVRLRVLLGGLSAESSKYRLPLFELRENTTLTKFVSDCHSISPACCQEVWCWIVNFASAVQLVPSGTCWETRASGPV